MRFDGSVHINRPPQDVLAFLLDIQDHALAPGSPVAAMDKIPPGPTRVGTRWREVVRLGPGARMTMWSEAIALEPGRSLDLRFWGGSMRGTIRYTVSPEGGRTTLRQQESLSAVGWLAPFERLAAAMLAPRLRARLLDIKTALEPPDA